MKTLLSIGIVLLAGLVFTSCDLEDPGPVQNDTRDFTVVDFDRLEMGSAFVIEVVQGSVYKIEAWGDRRNLDDLLVYKNGQTLIIRYDESTNRRYETTLRITMPELAGFNFSGASNAVVSGFESQESLDVALSGASVAQLDAGYSRLNIQLSGSSSLVLHGLGDQMNASISGASLLSAFDYPVREAEVTITGASEGKLFVSDLLDVTASGASKVLYRGTPTVTSEVTGGSSVKKD